TAPDLHERRSGAVVVPPCGSRPVEQNPADQAEEPDHTADDVADQADQVQELDHSRDTAAEGAERSPDLVPEASPRGIGARHGTFPATPSTSIRTSSSPLTCHLSSDRWPLSSRPAIPCAPDISRAP